MKKFFAEDQDVYMIPTDKDAAVYPRLNVRAVANGTKNVWLDSAYTLLAVRRKATQPFVCMHTETEIVHYFVTVAAKLSIKIPDNWHVVDTENENWFPAAKYLKQNSSVAGGYVWENQPRANKWDTTLLYISPNDESVKIPEGWRLVDIDKDSFIAYADCAKYWHVADCCWVASGNSVNWSGSLTYIVPTDRLKDYRPFSDQHEALPYIQQKYYVRHKRDRVYARHITLIYSHGVGTNVDSPISWQRFLEEYEFVDGTPCGVSIK